MNTTTKTPAELAMMKATGSSDVTITTAETFVAPSNKIFPELKALADTVPDQENIWIGYNDVDICIWFDDDGLPVVSMYPVRNGETDVDTCVHGKLS